MVKAGRILRDLSKFLAIGEYFPWVSEAGKPAALYIHVYIKLMWMSSVREREQIKGWLILVINQEGTPWATLCAVVAASKC